MRCGPGEVAEWLKAPLSKSGILSKTGSWVQIPPSPPDSAAARLTARRGVASVRSQRCSGGTWFAKRSIRGEMSELAEGTRLEIVCAANTGTVGSNPTLSAIFCTIWHVFDGRLATAVARSTVALRRRNGAAVCTHLDACDQKAAPPGRTRPPAGVR